MRKQRILDILTEKFLPKLVDLIDESYSHSGSRVETHFKLTLISDAFAGLSRVDRQRMVNEALKSEFASGLHALTQRIYTLHEWESQGKLAKFISPTCMGKSGKSN